MRCPKCHYLSFDPEPRCRNCGYDLEVTDADLALHTSEASEEDSVPDLTLHDRADNAEAAPITLELVHSGANNRTAVVDRPRRKPRAKAIPPQRLTLVDEPVDEIYEEPSRQLEPEAAEFSTEGAEEEPEERSAGAEVAEPVPAFVLPERTLPEPLVPPTFAAAVLSEPELSKSSVPEPVFRSAHTTEMPLFVKGMAESDLEAEAVDVSADLEDVPMVPPTRPPLAVRRTTQEPARTQARVSDRRLGPLDHDLLEDLKRVEREETARHHEHARMIVEEARLHDEPLKREDLLVRESARVRHEPPVGVEYMDEGEAVAPRTRLAAAAIDVGVLGGIAAFVFWATLRLCNVSIEAVGWSALIPFMIFIAVMDLSYLLMFTAAGGQTVGKMLMHIRVVSEDRAIDDPVPMGRAAWRSLLTMVSVIGLGLGWLPAMFGRGLTLHDRLAHTRVVRA